MDYEDGFLMIFNAHTLITCSYIVECNSNPRTAGGDVLSFKRGVSLLLITEENTVVEGSKEGRRKESHGRSLQLFVLVNLLLNPP